MSERVRLQDVADRARVSPATVSLVLNQRPGVRISEATRDRVLRAAARLGYHPNHIARSLARGQTHTIGVLVPTLASAFYAVIVDGIEAACAAHEQRVLLAHSRLDVKREAQQVELLIEHQVDGIICLMCENLIATTPRWLAPLIAERVPCVLVDEHQADLPVDAVISDDVPGAFTAIAHLVKRGHRRIAHLSAGAGSSSSRARLEGYQQALLAHRIPVERQLIVGDSYDAASGRRAMERLLRLAQPPTAVFAANDTLAAEAMTVIAGHGLRVPDDFAVVGFSNDIFAQYLGLTSVHQVPFEMGRRAAERLLRRIAKPSLAPGIITVPTQLIARASSAGRRPSAPRSRTSRTSRISTTQR